MKPSEIGSGTTSEVRVGIKKTSLTDLGSDLEVLLDWIGYCPSKEKVLLKPNVVVAEPPENGAVTHPQVTEALIRYFRKRNCQVVVAEGTGIFADAPGFARLLKATGYQRLADELGVPIINLEDVERESIAWRYGTLDVPKLLRECEYVNVPSVKTHGQTMVTLGVKNQKGLLPMRQKKVFHKKDLHGCILALSDVIRPALTVVDGIYCVEGRGPTGPPVGTTKRMDLLLAGRDMMAVDNICLDLMGIPIEAVHHLRPVEHIEVVGERLSDVAVDFQRPVLGTFSLDAVRVYSDEKTCTMCTVSLHKALSKMYGTPELERQLRSRPDLGAVHIVMGQAEPPAEAMSGAVVCIGDCSRKTARRLGLPHIAGCHPDYRDVINHLFPGTYDRATGSRSRDDREAQDE